MGELMFGEVADNLLLMLVCYLYILLMIFISSKMGRFLDISRKTSRKFLHAMIGNLPFIMTFFTTNLYPTLVAAPFILVTFLASPVSPFKSLRTKLSGLADITEEGHHLGLVFYAISYTVLAWLFGTRSYVVAAGILPMAYGDSLASLIGEKYGRRKYRLVASKSLEGSIAMFLGSFLSLAVSMVFFIQFYPLSLFGLVLPVFCASLIATLVEGFSLKGFDNVTVPFFSVIGFVLFSGGI